MNGLPWLRNNMIISETNDLCGQTLPTPQNTNRKRAVTRKQTGQVNLRYVNLSSWEVNSLKLSFFSPDPSKTFQ